MSYEERLSQLQSILNKELLDGLIVDCPVNLYYLTGLQLSSGLLLVTQQKAFLIVDGRYYERCQKQNLFPVILQGSTSFVELFVQNHSKTNLKIGFDSEKTTYQNYLTFYRAIQEYDKRTHKKDSILLVALENINQNPLKRLRCIKSEEELEYLRQAAELGCQGFEFACNLLVEGITEIEVARELEMFCRSHGADKLAFDPIIAFGKNTSMPHYRPGHTPLKREQPVLIDMGVTLSHYHSDMTRVLFFGFAEPAILKIYDVVQKAQQAALDSCRPGMKIGELDKIARDIIISEGYGEYFPHGLGHGIGLEVHEAPTIKNNSIYENLELSQGMVITIEPGVYIPELGGVRIEDTIIITSEGYELLTKRTKNPVFK